MGYVDSKDKAYEEGWRAFEGGIDFFDNAYASGITNIPLMERWNDGWRAARLENEGPFNGEGGTW